MAETVRAAEHAASVEEIRSHFPALARIHEGQRVAYFDGPGGTQVPRAVVEAMSDYLYHHNANTHWAYPTSAETDELLERSRGSLADFLGATPGEVAFGANATTLAFHVSRTLGRTFEAGDEIVVRPRTPIDVGRAQIAQRLCEHIHLVQVHPAADGPGP